MKKLIRVTSVVVSLALAGCSSIPKTEFVELEPKIVIKREFVKCPVPKELVTPAKINANVKTLLELIENVKDTNEANRIKLKLIEQIECLEIVGG